LDLTYVPPGFWLGVAISAASLLTLLLIVGRGLRHNASHGLKVRFLGLLDRKRRQSVEEFWALRNVSIRIDRGEAVGLVGRNGSGRAPC
jgi:ABC-type polysaccharide/polyol phosphate transport system ATPase subunit